MFKATESQLLCLPLVALEIFDVFDLCIIIISILPTVEI